MIVLDENLPASQRQLLRGWGVRARQIGVDLGRSGMKDDEIVPLLHQLSWPTLFTRDLGFYDRRLCHPAYSLVVLAVGSYEAASFVRRVLRHPAFRTRRQRLGAVAQAGHLDVRLWRLHAAAEEVVPWPPS